jgi:diaminohydroxyphosphoribosylaminopyrimidine deaminase/5-amino-6-(5-phosphoribosylamino)uracil reductase
VEVLALPFEEGRVSPYRLLQELGSRQITSLLVEGGAEVHGSFFRAGLVDKVYFFYAPKIIGGKDTVPLVGGRGAAGVGDSLALSRVRVRRFDGDIMVEAYVATSPLLAAGAG